MQKANSPPMDEQQATNQTGAAPVSRSRVVTVQPALDSEELRKAQLEEETLRLVIAAKKNPSQSDLAGTIGLSPKARIYKTHWDQLEMRGGVLHRKWESDDRREIKSLTVLPAKHHEEVVSQIHGSVLGDT